MASSSVKSGTIPFRCEGYIDPYTGAVEVRSIDCEGMPEMETVLRERLQSLRRWDISTSKLRSWFLLILLATVLAACYGAIHNQLSYGIAPEYFTKIKFQRAGVTPSLWGGERSGAAYVGVVSSWWVGALAALLLGPIGMIHPDRTMFRRTLRAVLIVLGTAIVCGGLGYVLGLILGSCGLVPPSYGSRYDFPDRLFAVQWMHACGYLGVVFGLLIGMVDLRRIACAIPETDNRPMVPEPEDRGKNSRYQGENRGPAPPDPAPFQPDSDSEGTDR